MFYLFFAITSLVLSFRANAATFTNLARVEIQDTTGDLSFKPSVNALTVSCWFKLSFPSDADFKQNMVIVANRKGGTQADRHAYWVQFNIFNGNVEFSSRGSSGLYTNTLIERPYLERWYHIAVVRDGESFFTYVDGREGPSGGGAAGDSSGGDGASIGGVGDGFYLYGEVQEFAVFQGTREQEKIVNYMFQDQPSSDGTLKAYYKLGYSDDASKRFKNFAPTTLPDAVPAGTGTVKFEETDKAGEQSAFDAKKNGGRDALTPLSGAFSWQQTLLSRGTPGVPFELSIGYSSGNAGTYKLTRFDANAAGPIGKDWRHSFETRVLPSSAFSPLADADTIGVLNWNGSIDTWDLDPSSGEYAPRDLQYRGEFVFTSTNCQWTTPQRLIYSFKLPDRGQPSQMRGRLQSIRDFNNNVLRLLWDESSAILTQVVDSAQGVYDFRYAGERLTNVSFRGWSVDLKYDSSNRLASRTITGPLEYAVAPTLWQFFYHPTNGLLNRVLDPRGNTNILVNYDQYGRKTNEIDALNRTNKTQYGESGSRKITHVDAANFPWIETYDRKGHLLSQQDPLTNVTRFAYDTNGNQIRITEPLGWETTMGYDDRANMIARTNALNQVTKWVIHPKFNKPVQEINPLNWTNYFVYDDERGNLLRHYDDLGTLVGYAYFTNGLLKTATDANGNLTQYGYDTNGFLKSKIDPATNEWKTLNSELGWKLSETNPRDETVSRRFDINGNAVLTTDALFRHYTNQFDGNGNLLLASDARGKVTQYLYDAANQKTNMVDRTGTNVWKYQYNSRGQLEVSTDPLNNATTIGYDPANRQITVKNALSLTTTNVFDANGKVTDFFDSTGKRWVKQYDRLNRITTEVDPLGNAKRTTFDEAGRVFVVSTPNGFPSTNFYDGRGRLKTWIDAIGSEWKYDYDGVGNITNITDALKGNYVMMYSRRNERVFEKNQDGLEWHYDYDKLVRLRFQRDPNNLTRRFQYDEGGRLRQVAFNTGRVDSMDYDENDNLRVARREIEDYETFEVLDSVTTAITPDIMDRMAQVRDDFGELVGYDRDALGRIIHLTYPGGKTLTNQFDAIGRLTNQIDWLANQTGYQYDDTGRLVRRSYPNGVIQTNVFDDAGRLLSLSHAPAANPPLTNTIQIALNYAYDHNGNKTSSRERGTLSWAPPAPSEESADFTPAGRLKTRTVTDSSSASAWTYQYDATGNLTNAVNSAQKYSLLYDEDNRTTSIAWTTNGVTIHIDNRYDFFGRKRQPRRLS